MPQAARCTFWIALAGLLASCASSPDPSGSGEPAVVRFSFEGVTPQTVEVPAGGNVGWVNEAPDATGYVVLPSSVASSESCDDVGPDFRESPGGYRSVAIQPFEEEPVLMPCPLPPGEYDYEILVTGTGLGEGVGGGPTLHGRIVVE